ncbi:Adenine phosphoribosyltransferase [Aedoeadaptatus ivorii]|uniref:Adenine phosphoribosyltransferase n=1 Tax=Aedoeadaptatus ivorii TaxID=54006 RepID=A0A3S5BWN4_9FIRM|nr:adenine phosphoribosyltransferase [Peptoniphilus ivorii]MDQ0508328.1 adenine phosphoribosyltransferase [Peptoniphilus ivorii]VEJ36303.1 Adenine phosphoribosyltransferase [Peptoniphilus ivorii]
MDLKESIRSIEDYPQKGVTFRDITTLLKDKDAFREAIRRMAEAARRYEVDKVVGIEARGFLLGTPLALELGVGFVPIRKPGKLPYKKRSVTYDLEYGNDGIEIHEDAIAPKEKVLIVDDLLATGGTSLAAQQLVESLGGEVEAFVFLIELDALNGRSRIARPVESVLHY